MTKTHRRDRKSVRHNGDAAPGNAAIGEAADQGRAVFDMVENASRTFVTAWDSWQTEIAQFAKARLREDIEITRCLLDCETIEDAAKLQQLWAVNAAKAYADETNRLMRMTTQLMQRPILPDVESIR